jgi:hypothetical protein
MNPSGILSGAAFTVLPEFDYLSHVECCLSTGSWITGSPNRSDIEFNFASGSLGSCQFAQSIDLETTSGMEISGLNAEEQSDISLLLRYSAAQQNGFVYDVFTYVDQMLVLHENNVMELIQ